MTPLLSRQQLCIVTNVTILGPFKTHSSLHHRSSTVRPFSAPVLYILLSPSDPWRPRTLALYKYRVSKNVNKYRRYNFFKFGQSICHFLINFKYHQTSPFLMECPYTNLKKYCIRGLRKWKDQPYLLVLYLLMTCSVCYMKCNVQRMCHQSSDDHDTETQILAAKYL